MEDMDFGDGDLMDTGGGDSGGFDMSGGSGIDSSDSGGLNDGGSSDLGGGSDDPTSDNSSLDTDSGGDLNDNSLESSETPTGNETDNISEGADSANVAGKSDNLNTESQESDTDTTAENTENENGAEANNDLNAEQSGDQKPDTEGEQKLDAGDERKPDTEGEQKTNDHPSDFEKINHPNMTLEEVQELQGIDENGHTTGEGTGNDAFKESLPEDYKPNEIELQDGKTMDDFNAKYEEVNGSLEDEIENENSDSPAIEQPAEISDAADYEEYDPKWENPSYEDIVAEPDAVEDRYSDENRDFVKAWNTAASAGIDSTIEGSDTSGLTDSINENDALIDKEIDAGYGIAGRMRDMNGGITETDRIVSQLPNNQDIPEE